VGALRPAGRLFYCLTGENTLYFGSFFASATPFSGTLLLTKTEIERLLREFKGGKISEAEVVKAIASLRFESLGFATVDHHRHLRHGFPEVIFCQGKTPEQAASIAAAVSKGGRPLLATRAGAEHFLAVKKKVPGAAYNDSAKTITANEPKKPRDASKRILVVSAGTSDMPVAEEAAVTARICGNAVDTLYDVGVAGLHRLLSKSDLLLAANVVIVVAGMEGALPSVVGGLVDVPVIAVPTSIGYGASFQGVAALLAMLNSCASGVTVVNIDNGFGAGYAASLINGRR
jgi:NCAIR mutase (PurE)-related protein